MSFGEGDLHAKVEQLERDLSAAEERIEKLKALNGELCAEVNEKGRRIRELEADLREFRDMNNEAGDRIGELESLARHLLRMLIERGYPEPWTDIGTVEQLCDRMAALGLLEGGE